MRRLEERRGKRKEGGRKGGKRGGEGRRVQETFFRRSGSSVEYNIDKEFLPPPLRKIMMELGFFPCRVRWKDTNDTVQLKNGCLFIYFLLFCKARSSEKTRRIECISNGNGGDGSFLF